MRVAFVYDRLNKVGGAEQVLQAFHEIYPEADWYTAVWNPVSAQYSAGWSVHTSFLQTIRYLQTRHELVPFLMPFAFESFNLSRYDLVISVGSAESKSVLTKPETLHLNYCLTPTRYLWSHRDEYLASVPRLLRPLARRVIPVMQSWDQVAAQRPDEMISISELVKTRVNKYYNRDSDVIYPPVDTKKFRGTAAPRHRDTASYYLVVSRLVPYKKIDLIVEAFNQSGRSLVIAGIGSEFVRLKKLAKGNISFLGYIKDSELPGLYAGCRAFIQANEEDFGIAMVEVLASGKPVIAYRGGGACEIVSADSGLLYNEPSAASLNTAIDRFETMKIAAATCRSQAAKFDRLIWQTKIRERINRAWHNHNQRYAIPRS